MDISEQQVVGAVLLNEKAYYAALKRGVTENSFQEPGFKNIWDGIVRCKAKHHVIDARLVAKEINASIDQEKMMSDAIGAVITVTNVGSYIDELRGNEQIRLAKCVMQDALADTENNGLIDRVISDLIKINRVDDVSIFQLKDLREAKIEQWRTAKAQGFVGVPFCIAGVNKYLGGWRNGCLTILGAYRGVGKSTLLRQDAYENAKAGRNVLLISLEDPADMAGAGIAGMHSGISTFHCDTGDAYDQTIDAIDRGWKEIGNLPLWIVSQSLTMTKILALAEMMNMRQKLDIIYLDHIQFVSPLMLQGNNRTGTLAQYSLSLSDLAKKLNIPIVCASQLNRDCEKESRTPRLSDLRDSGSLEQDARQVLLLWYDADQRHHVIAVAKNNYGISGKEISVWRLDGKNRFSEVQPEVIEDAQ